MQLSLNSASQVGNTGHALHPLLTLSGVFGSRGSYKKVHTMSDYFVHVNFKSHPLESFDVLLVQVIIYICKI
jgi:hypothetical protein